MQECAPGSIKTGMQSTGKAGRASEGALVLWSSVPSIPFAGAAVSSERMWWLVLGRNVASGATQAHLVAYRAVISWEEEGSHV